MSYKKNASSMFNETTLAKIAKKLKELNLKKKHFLKQCFENRQALQT